MPTAPRGLDGDPRGAVELLAGEPVDSVAGAGERIDVDAFGLS